MENDDKMNNLEKLQERLEQLKSNLASEPDKSCHYANDLRSSIEYCEGRIKQLTFARANPVLNIDNATL